MGENAPCSLSRFGDQRRDSEHERFRSQNVHAADRVHVASSLLALSWNTAGIAEEQLDVFLMGVEEMLSWDVLCLQETFARTEGVKVDKNLKHVFYTPTEKMGGLRVPAIFVHERWARLSRYLGSGKRWVAAKVSDMTFVSIHLPHTRSAGPTLQETLNEVDEFMSNLKCEKLFMGIDANTKMYGCCDGESFGESIPAGTAEDPERQQAIYEFFKKWHLWAPNTWLSDGDGDEQRWKTRFEWSAIKQGDFSSGGTQIDFAALSYKWPVQDVEVVQDTAFNTDHCLVAVRLEIKKEKSERRAKPTNEEKKKQQQQAALKNWEPAESWPEAICREKLKWDDWDSAVADLTSTAAKHAKPNILKAKDAVLEELLCLRNIATDQSTCRDLGQEIWRARRRVKREAR